MKQESKFQPFVIFTMPLTLDAWMAKWLRCGHNGMLRFPTLDTWLEDVQKRGSVESFLPLSWKVVKQRIPDVKLIAVSRPIEEIVEHLEMLGKAVDREMLWQHFYVLEAIAHVPGTAILDVSKEGDVSESFHKMWKYLQPREPFDEEWYDACVESETQDFTLGLELCNQQPMMESIQLTRQLGGNASTLWLN